MNLDDLWERIENRLDKQDEERKVLVRELAALGREMGEVKTAVQGNGDTCTKRHESVTKKIEVRDKFLALGIIGVVGAAGKLVWDAVTRKV